jgi:UDP-N-acetylmuramyl pentapeptide phosphotransferase/UDP-N-acetylglucosamine-1-phosphate transferase
MRRIEWRLQPMRMNLILLLLRSSLRRQSFERRRDRRHNHFQRLEHHLAAELRNMWSAPSMVERFVAVDSVS